LKNQKVNQFRCCRNRRIQARSLPKTVMLLQAKRWSGSGFSLPVLSPWFLSFRRPVG